MKTQIVTKRKKTPIVIKLKNSTFDKTQKPNWQQNPKTQIVKKLFKTYQNMTNKKK